MYTKRSVLCVHKGASIDAECFLLFPLPPPRVCARVCLWVCTPRKVRRGHWVSSLETVSLTEPETDYVY